MALTDHNIIGDVTKTMGELLEGLDVTYASPVNLPNTGEEGSSKINIYLYQVLEDPNAKNQNWLTKVDGEQQYPPLALDLFYLVTPYAIDAGAAHNVLTHAMRRYHDKAVLIESELIESLRLSVDQLSIALCNLELEELTRIWNALQTPYRLSVCYEVRVVLIHSERTRDPHRVFKKTNQYEQK